MAETAITAVLSKLGELAVSEVNALLQVGDDIILLRDRLEWLQEFVRDADRRRRAGTVDVLTQVLVRQTRDVALEAQYALDDYFHEEVVDQDSGQRWKTFYRCFTGFGKKLVVRHGLSDRVKMIKSRLDQISVNQKEYNIVHTASVVLASSTTAIAAWRNDLENAVGFDEDVITIMGMLSHKDVHNQKPIFISIVGESGAGKNTLAGIICRLMMPTMDAVVRHNMEPGSSTENVLTEVHRLVSLRLGDRLEQTESSSGDIGDKLRRLLARKRYLLILGGICSKATLNCLKASLPDDNGCDGNVMLILDTENEEVGWHANTINIVNRHCINGVHLLSRLDRERSVQLFFWKVFRKGQSHGKESNRREEYEKKRQEYTALKQKGEEEEKLLKQKREEEEKQAEPQDEEERAAIKKERFDNAMEFAAVMREREEREKTEEEIAALKKKREEKEKEEQEEQAALKKKREEKEKEEEEEQAALKKRREQIKKQKEQELAALKQKIEETEKEEAVDGDLHERLVHEITGGYPMAIVLLAGLLRFKEKPGQWNAVLEQLKPSNNGSAQDDGGEGLPNGQINSTQQGRSGARRAIEVVFWASFEDLPSNLKSCYLYFVGYPRNFSHSADTIVRMWVAEGFIRRQKGKTMEEVGYDYLKELVLRCLVEVEEMKIDGGIKLVRVHRSLMGFLQSEVRESGFMEIHDIHEALVPSSVCRLSVQSCDGSRYTSTFVDKKLPKLRSFICHIDEHRQTIDEHRVHHDLRQTIDDCDRHHHHDLKFLLWSRFLRVISVHGLGLTELPDQIGDMIQLRYLRIDCWSLKDLPSSIAKLLNLQTLDITNTQVVEIHEDFWKIKTLRHVLARNLALPELALQETVSVVVEGQGGGELQTLHGELQTLHGVNPVRWWGGNCPLDKMKNLQSLELDWFAFMGQRRGVSDALRRMPLLGHLKLQGDEIPTCVFTDPSLRSLQTMALHGKVNWEDITRELPGVDHPLRKVRPNLIQLKLNGVAISGMPQSISEQLDGILIRED